MTVPFTIIIPCRYASTRLPGKPLLEIKGKSLIQNVYEIAKSSDAKQIYIATDDERISIAAREFGAEVIMTSTEHRSGTDRLAEVIEKENIDDDEIIVNLQGDEYALPVSLLNQVAKNLHHHPEMQVATLCETIDEYDNYTDSNIVKVVFDKTNSALYFSRSPVPASRTNEIPENVYRHIGLYSYRAGYLKEFTRLPPCPIEISEALEQLRVLYYGGKIHVDIALEKTGIGIDTNDDLERARTA
ncbi:MAG: 3-deoxy-manno-octulosonate cytidylyltransferase [Proteobacteria bacterium]|nr:3-deoxy-manno-octulosonate cytidylyltransferase [Pseudomonadota bacterium]